MQVEEGVDMDMRGMVQVVHGENPQGMLAMQD